MTDQTAADVPVWQDEHPLMEAIAAAVWEHCEKQPGSGIVIDDPRNIAAAAHLAVRAAARQAAGQPAAATTAGKAAALGTTPTDYRRYRHDAAVEEVREAAKGLYAETGLRVMDALEQPIPAVGGQDAGQPAEAVRTLTPLEHDRAWHAIEHATGQDAADPGTVLNAVLHALRINTPTVEDEQAASPRHRQEKTR
jgi:hypothetical protein